MRRPGSATTCDKALRRTKWRRCGYNGSCCGFAIRLSAAGAGNDPRRKPVSIFADYCQYRHRSETCCGGKRTFFSWLVRLRVLSRGTDVSERLTNESNQELAFATIEELAPLLAKKKISPVELTKDYLSRIERLNPELNAFITVTTRAGAGGCAGGRARTAARAAAGTAARHPRRAQRQYLDERHSHDGWVGDSARFVPDEDATVARRLKQAGAVLLGKTNLHEFAYGATNQNPHFGPTHNPWAADRITGGSSGGSAAAVCAGLVRGRVGIGHGRLDPRARRALRDCGAEADLWAGERAWGVCLWRRVLTMWGRSREAGGRGAGAGSARGARSAGPDQRVEARRRILHRRDGEGRRKLRLGWPQEHFWERIRS